MKSATKEEDIQMVNKIANDLQVYTKDLRTIRNQAKEKTRSYVDIRLSKDKDDHGRLIDDRSADSIIEFY
jgi:hypothetical protein